MHPTKRKSFSIEEKNIIIQRLEAGESNVKIAKEFGVNHSTISTIKKNKKKIESLFYANVLKSKRVRVSSQDQVDFALLEWFKWQRNRGISVNGPMLLRKANYFAKQLNINNFDCSVSWIHRFKNRHNIASGKITGKPVEHNVVSEWQTKVWPNLRAKFSDDDIFNVVETGLFYKFMPNKTFKLREKKCMGGILSKDKITVMVAANMSGSIKKKLLIISKLKNPRCFKKVRSLPVDYHHNRRAWMTADIFIKWVCDWDRELIEKEKKILLIVDNSPAHPSISDLKSITLIFLPPNTTSVLQPLNQGVISVLKTNFRKNLISKKFASIEANEDISSANHSKITILDAILMIYDTWNKLTSVIIFNCFKHAGFVQDNRMVAANIDDDDKEEKEEVGATVLNKRLNIKYEKLDQYSAAGDVMCEEPTNENISQNVMTIVNTDDDNDDGPEEKFTTPSVSEALKAAKVLNKFVHSNYNDDTTIMTIMSRLYNTVLTSYYRSTNQKQ